MVGAASDGNRDWKGILKGLVVGKSGDFGRSRDEGGMQHGGGGIVEYEEDVV